MTRARAARVRSTSAAAGLDSPAARSGAWDRERLAERSDRDGSQLLVAGLRRVVELLGGAAPSWEQQLAAQAHAAVSGCMLYRGYTHDRPSGLKHLLPRTTSHPAGPGSRLSAVLFSISSGPKRQPAAGCSGGDKGAVTLEPRQTIEIVTKQLSRAGLGPRPWLRQRRNGGASGPPPTALGGRPSISAVRARPGFPNR